MQDRFFMTLSDLDAAQQVCLLSSARYALFLCDLTTADNFRQVQIDNLCCERFTLSNRRDVRYDNPHRVDRVVPVISLVNLPPVHDQDHMAEQKGYLQLVLGCVKFLRSVHSISHWYRVENFIDDSVGFSDIGGYYDEITRVKKSIYRELLTSVCWQTAKSNIENVTVDAQLRSMLRSCLN